MDDADLRRWFDEQVETHAFSGVAMAWRDGKRIFAYAGGLAHRGHGVRVTETTRFGVASVTKLPTAIALLRLIDRGLAGIDQPVVEILPRGQRPAALSAGVSLHHLLSHTSGLANYFDDDAPAGFAASWDRIPSYRVRHPADLLPLFRDLPAVFRAGERQAYCDTNFVLVGLVLEALTGNSFDDVVAREVFAPARMLDTAFEAIDDDPARLAVGYVMDDGPANRWRANYFSVTANGMPDGGMITTAPDLAALIDSLLEFRLLPPQLVAAMTTPQGPPSAGAQQWGYGCELAVEAGVVRAIGHGGSDPGVSARVSHFLESRTTIVAICNQDRGSWAATLRVAEALGLHDPRA